MRNFSLSLISSKKPYRAWKFVESFWINRTILYTFVLDVWHKFLHRKYFLRCSATCDQCNAQQAITDKRTSEPS